METEQGGYRELLRLRFEMDISPILAFTINKNYQCGFFKTFVNQISKTPKNIKKTFANKMETEHGGYREHLRLGFKMDISQIQALVITQNTSRISNSFLSVV